jgi:sugar/nucleoside kinase (ribokinase family)
MPPRCRTGSGDQTVSATLDLLVVGDVNPDVVVRGAPRELAFRQAEHLAAGADLGLGGSAAITACGAARLGLSTAIVGAVGDDAAGRLALDELARRDVDTSFVRVVREQASGLTVHILSEADRAMITSRGALDELEASAVPAALVAAARHVHAASFYLQPRLAPGLRGLFEAAHAAGATTSLDLNWDPAERWQGGVAELLPAVDILFVNAVEAAGVSGATDPAVAATVLAARGPLPVVKLGASGALAHDGCRLVHVDAPATSVVDSVGAGDGFDAGFLCGRLSGWTVSRSLALGVVCGSLSVRAAGGVAAQPSRADAEAAMAGLLPIGDDVEECDR